MPTLTDHLESIARFVGDVSEKNAVVFAASCVERQVPVYERWCEESGSPHRDGLRRILDSVWGWIREDESPNNAIRQSIEELLPEEVTDEMVGAVVDFVAGADHLLTLTESFSADLVSAISETSIEKISALLYHITDIEIGPEHFDRLDSHELNVAEYARQDVDMRDLRNPFSVELADKIRQRSMGVSIFGDDWYPDDA
jgi:uncharacterized protein YjaG (DUF416 family)